MPRPCIHCDSPIEGHYCPNAPIVRALDLLAPCVKAGGLTYPGSDGQYHYGRVVGGRIFFETGIGIRPYLKVERGYYGPGRIYAEDRPQPYAARV